MASPAHQTQKETPAPKAKSEFESTALLLQGGGALGAYQAGVYEALAEAELAPDWVGGISIGAINGAIIAGNKPSERVAKLRGFWEGLTANPVWDQFSAFNPFIEQAGTVVRAFWNQMNAGMSMTQGVPGFFKPRLVPPWLSSPGTAGATSYYSVDAFKATLERFIDFDVLNSGAVRFTTSAVNVRTGNYTLFDTKTQKVGPEHVMASGALPPALPAVEIEGQYYWDGGLLSNTPLQWVMNDSTDDTLIFQVDLWSAEGEYPKDMIEVMTREKEIQYSSRTRAMTEKFKRTQQLRHAFSKLYAELTDAQKQTEEVKLLQAASDYNVYNLVHLIYRTRHYEGYAKDFEFSRLSMEEHWKAGYNDTVRTLRHKSILKRPTCAEGIMIYDVAQD